MTIFLVNGRLSNHSMLVIVGGELDGVRADSLRLHTLRRELERMGVPGIDDECMGKNALLAAFHREVSRVANKHRTSGRSRAPLLSEVVAR